ncbi:hypothetical protein BSKO_09532 [Bryopsis sp. KO-2023]|nr:hypothetical protein BSKO_09532 [Bryopsis sp. KO-2023]
MKRSDSGGFKIGKGGPPGDPRRPNEVRKYIRPVVNMDTQPPDSMLFGALFCGMIALILKIKLAAWASLFFCISALANMKSEQMDFKQIVSSLTFAVMGLVASYLVPMTQAERRAGA